MYMWGAGARCLYTFLCVFTWANGGQRLSGIFISWNPEFTNSAGHLASQWASEICLRLPPQHWYYRCVLQCFAFSEDVGDPNLGPEACLANTLSIEPSPQPPKNSLSKKRSLVCEQSNRVLSAQKIICRNITVVQPLTFPNSFISYSHVENLN